MISFDPNKRQNLIGYTWNNIVEPGFLFRLSDHKSSLLLYVFLEKIKWTILQPIILLMIVPIMILFVNNIMLLIFIPSLFSLIILLFNIIITKVTNRDFGVYFYNDRVIFSNSKEKLVIYTDVFNKLCLKQNIKPLYISKNDISLWRVFEADNWPFSKSRVFSPRSSIFDSSLKQEAINKKIWNKKVNESFSNYRYKNWLTEQIIANINYKEFVNDVKEEFDKLLVKNNDISNRFNKIILNLNKHIEKINKDYNKNKYDNIDEIMSSREIDSKLDLDKIKKLCTGNKLKVAKIYHFNDKTNNRFNNEKYSFVVKKKIKKIRWLLITVLMLLINVFLYMELISVGEKLFIDFKYESIFMYLFSSYFSYIIVIILCKYFINNYNNIEIILSKKIIIKTKKGTAILQNKISKDTLKLLENNEDDHEINTTLLNIINKI